MNNKKKSGTSSEGDEMSEVEESSALGPEDIGEVIRSKERADKIVRLMPLHAVVGASKGIQRQVGRPRKVERRPTESDLEYHETMIQEKAEFIEEDPVVHAIQTRTDTADMLTRIKEEVAREAASLLFQRRELEKFGRDTSQVSTRRIDALKKIAEIELEIKKMGADSINLKSERMQKLFTFIINSVREGCVATGMNPQQVDLLFNHLGTTFEGWEDRASDVFR